MATPLSRPELRAHDHAMRAPFPVVVQELRDLLTPRLVACVGGVRETRAVHLAYFRPDPAVVAGLGEIAGADADEPPPAGVVPREWVAARCVGTAVLAGEYVDVGHHETIAELRVALAARVVHHRVGDLDAGTIRLSAPRAFTQEVLRYVYERSAGGARTWDGISYRSKHGDDLQNWAIFEPCAPDVVDVAGVDAADADLAAAVALHGLTLG